MRILFCDSKYDSSYDPLRSVIPSDPTVSLLAKSVNQQVVMVHF